MPIKECQTDGKKGFKWGDSGKCYTYTDTKSKEDAKEKARKQGQAIKSKEAVDELSASFEELGYQKIAFTSKEIGIAKMTEGTISFSDMNDEFINDEKGARKYTVVNAIAAIGDRFYGNIYVPSDVLRATYRFWNSTYNDISHLGTMFPAGTSSIENMEYITGFNSDASYDEMSKSLNVKMHISHESPKYQTWKSFMDISKDANRIPNVSIFGFYKAKAIHKSKIAAGAIIPQGALRGDYVIAMTHMIPFAITTCLKGKCDDAAGCGISVGFSEDGNPCDCTSGVCDIPKVSENTEKEEKKPEISKEELEKIERLKKRIKELK